MWVNKKQVGGTYSTTTNCLIFILPDYLLILPTENSIFDMSIEVPVALKRKSRQPLPDHFEILEIKSASWNQIRISYHGSKHPMMHVNPNYITNLVLKPRNKTDKERLELALNS